PAAAGAPPALAATTSALSMATSNPGTLKSFSAAQAVGVAPIAGSASAPSNTAMPGRAVLREWIITVSVDSQVMRRPGSTRSRSRCTRLGGRGGTPSPDRGQGAMLLAQARGPHHQLGGDHHRRGRLVPDGTQQVLHQQPGAGVAVLADGGQRRRG